MIVRVETPSGDRGQVYGYIQGIDRSHGFTLGNSYFYVLVAIEGKAGNGNGKLEVHKHDDLVVKVVEPEYGE